MKIEVVNTVEQYKALINKDLDDRDIYFKDKMMKPFESMWLSINVPMNAKQQGGYDVKMATQMLGFESLENTESIKEALVKLIELNIEYLARKTLSECLKASEKAGLKISSDLLKFAAFISAKGNPHVYNDYVGFGGIPGYIIIMLRPNDYNIPRIPSLIAHEFHHNLRFSYFDWNHGNVTLGDYIVIEGLAESFATEMYGEEYLGPWVTSIVGEELEYSTHVIGENVNQKGFAEVSSYMFGDEQAKSQGYNPVGLSAGAGYAVGYQVVQSFLKKQNRTIYDATLLGTDEIIKGSGMFR
ncbi:DUF2268 domain-containing protein [Bacillus sp. JCM 19034]|uniref:DUF2268 domain-containing protein n=1 Tax=Bacillus sp. JCM 19034 TaxID=1481928 RepID=UPI0007810B4C|nr:DUF2268 domain-containing putative Zn-dependent protease [Bacillus sp. JCM 19034]